MSGHSKWHNIQKTKGAADAKRAQAFTKIAREMIVAVKEGGGGDPRSNSKLATVIAKAKAANMPNDNIKRTIDKALGAGNTENYEKITYEGYGPQGVAVIVETMTDNRNRTAGEMRHYFDKYGGNMGAANCVSWSFDRKGVIVIDNEDEELDEDTVMMDALDAGADDFEAEGETMTVYTGEDDVAAVSEALTAKLSQPAPGVALPEPGQHRPVLLLPVEDAVLQPQPEQPLVLVPVLLLLKGGEDLLQSGPVIVTAHRPDDDIPIQLRLSVGIIGLEIRLKGIAPGRVPDDVHGPALLQL